MSEEHGNIAALSVSMWDCMYSPARDQLRPFAPENATDRAWIPQTVSDSIWVLYKFKSESERLAWESSLPPEISRWINRRIIPHALDFGWKTRDADGWPAG